MKYNINVIDSKDGKLYKKKRGYCEMAKIYYIYHLYKNGNLSSRYIGFNHYRRYFNFTDNIPDLDDIFGKYDIILNKPKNIPVDFRLYYCKFHYCKMYDEIINIIKDIKPEYYDSAIEVSKRKYMYICNLFIMKKEDFFKYCEFMFDILFEFDKRHNFNNDNDILRFTRKIYNSTYSSYLQSRLEAFLSERISNIFYYYNFKRIKNFKMIFQNITLKDMSWIWKIDYQYKLIITSEFSLTFYKRIQTSMQCKGINIQKRNNKMFNKNKFSIL